MSSFDSLTVPEYDRKSIRATAVSPGITADRGLQSWLDDFLPIVQSAVETLKSAKDLANFEDLKETRLAITKIYQLVQNAWDLPTLGRQVAEVICNKIRMDGVLELLLQHLHSPDVEITYESAKLLEQILIAENRDYVARMGLGLIRNLTPDTDPKLARSMSGILEHMFKHTEETSIQLISNGALDALLFWCRRKDSIVLRHCAMALTNCAMYGGHQCQRLMIEKRAAEWLFPLAFSKENEIIRLFACMAVAVLAANQEIEKEVVKSGTLELVEPFIASLDPEKFADNLMKSADNMQGRSAADLQLLLPLLDGTRLEGKCIAAFYLCVESCIKSHQRNTKIFQEIGAVQSLKRIVMYSSNATASSLAKRALGMIGEDVPCRILSSVPNWKSGEVKRWLQQIGFSLYTERFQELQVDGDLLLNITDEDLLNDLGMSSGLTRKRFLRDLCVLKTYANYSTCDPTNLADWLADVDPRFRQYTYGLVLSGVNRNNIVHITDEQLRTDCNVENGLHRAKILAAQSYPKRSPEKSPKKPQQCGPDVFISYRRTTGSQLASLLKVHLQLCDYSVFMDVETLKAGRFEEKLIQSVKQADVFILVLSANALDKCMEDRDMKDWMHKEIATALSESEKKKKVIIPVTDNFVWPDRQTLPDDMSSIVTYNGIKWSHEYQDASIRKILDFIKGNQSQDQLDRANDSELPKQEQI